MRDVWLYAPRNDMTRNVGAALVELGYRPRFVTGGAGIVPSGDGSRVTPPEFALVVSAPACELEVELVGQLDGAAELQDAPVLLAVEPEHLRAAAGLALTHEVLVTPFSAEELRMRIARATGHLEAQTERDIIRAGSLELNLATYGVAVDRRPVGLRYMEYQLLKFLMTHPNRVFAREALLSRVWGYDYYGGARTVDVHVRRLRAKLEAHAPRIQTVRSVGYLFDAGETLRTAAA